MVSFKQKSNGRIWNIINKEHIEHFRNNPRFEEIKEKKSEPKEQVTNKKEVIK